MTLTINDTTMTSNQTGHTVGKRPAARTDGKCPGCPARSWTATPPLPRWSWPTLPPRVTCRRAPALAAHPGLGGRTRPDRNRRDRPGLPAVPRPCSPGRTTRRPAHSSGRTSRRDTQTWRRTTARDTITIGAPLHRTSRILRKRRRNLEGTKGGCPWHALDTQSSVCSNWFHG
jgi:hypothetical protein